MCVRITHGLQKASIAKWIRHQSSKLVIPGSSPGGGTKLRGSVTGNTCGFDPQDSRFNP